MPPTPEAAASTLTRSPAPPPLPAGPQRVPCGTSGEGAGQPGAGGRGLSHNFTWAVKSEPESSSSRAAGRGRLMERRAGPASAGGGRAGVAPGPRHAHGDRARAHPARWSLQPGAERSPGQLRGCPNPARRGGGTGPAPPEGAYLRPPRLPWAREASLCPAQGLRAALPAFLLSGGLAGTAGPWPRPWPRPLAHPPPLRPLSPPPAPAGRAAHRLWLLAGQGSNPAGPQSLAVDGVVGRVTSLPYLSNRVAGSPPVPHAPCLPLPVCAPGAPTCAG